MGESSTPVLSVTQTGSGQSVELKASPGTSLTPPLAVVRVGDSQTITLRAD